MVFPKTTEQLIAAGYKRERQSLCRGPKCGRRIDWWLTPRGKYLPLDPETCQPHWTSCPDAEAFRAGNQSGKERP